MRTRALAVIADSHIMVGKVDAGCAKNLSVLEGFASLASRRLILLRVPRLCRMEFLFLFAAFTGDVTQIRVLGGVQCAFAFARFFLD